jgi:hypothetical protein
MPIFGVRVVASLVEGRRLPGRAEANRDLVEGDLSLAELGVPVAEGAVPAGGKVDVPVRAQADALVGEARAAGLWAEAGWCG